MTLRLFGNMLQNRITRSLLRKQSEVASLKADDKTSRYFTKPPSDGKGKTQNVNVLKEFDETVSETQEEKGKKRKSYKIEYEAQNETSDGGTKKLKKETVEWRTVHTNIQEMRRNRDAPVDTMGCDKLHDESASPQVQRYQVLLSLMLSSQTKDEITSAAMAKLLNHGCTVEEILATADKQLGELIYPVGFWRKKVEYIKKTSQILQDQYNSDIPNTVQDLCKLPGVGPKMAYLVMKSAWGEIVGIGVDVHVHRITNRLGWVNTKQPEQTRLALENWLPREYWSDINCLLVGFGQQTCLSVKPKCSECLNKFLCPEGRRQLKGKLKNVKESKN